LKSVDARAARQGLVRSRIGYLTGAAIARPIMPAPALGPRMKTRCDSSQARTHCAIAARCAMLHGLARRKASRPLLRAGRLKQRQSWVVF
jgi:hypothetical protein